MMQGFFGVVHVPPLPGDPCHRSGSFEDAYTTACRDAEALVQGGVDGLIIENFGSTPFPKGTADDRLPPHQVSALAHITRRCVQAFDVPVGVNCLRNDVVSALGIAASSGAQFVRVNILTGAYVTDQGIIEGEAAHALRYRQALGANTIAVCADVHVKHAKPLVPISPAETAHDATSRGLADALIVTGRATGRPVEPEIISEVRDACPDTPLLIGSGLHLGNAPSLAPLVQGAIVGTSLKVDGKVHAPVDIDRVRQLANLLKNYWPNQASR